VTALHASIYTMTLLLTGGLTLWAFFFIATGRVVDGAFRSTYLLTVGVTIVQGLIGLIMVIESLRAGQNIHYLYGISIIVFMGAGYVFATRGDQGREALIFGFMSATAFGLILRASETAFS
jgi:heme A synthase